MSKVNVYENGDVIARVAYNNKLDWWDGHNMTNGGIGMHKGITRLKDGTYVIIIGSQWEGSEDYAYTVSDSEALQEILRSGNTELLEQKKFADLKELMVQSLIAEDLDE
jgi:hypothetical protein